MNFHKNRLATGKRQRRYGGQDGTKTKGDIIRAIQNATGMPIRDIRDCVAATFHFISQSMIAGKPVAIPGFGTFCIRVRPGRTSILKNPHTGQRYKSIQPPIPCAKLLPSLILRKKLKANIPKTINTPVE